MNINSVFGSYSVLKSQVKKNVSYPSVSFKSESDVFISFKGVDPINQIHKKIDKIPSQSEKESFLSVFTEWENSCTDDSARKELYKFFKSKLVTEDNGNKYNPFFVKLINLGFSFDEVKNILSKNPEIINRNGNQKVLDLIIHVSNFCGVEDRSFYGCHIKEFYDDILSALDIEGDNDAQPVDVSGIVNNYVSPLKQDNNHKYSIQRHLFSDGSKCYKFSVSSDGNNEQSVYFDIDKNNSDDFLTVYNFYDESGTLLNNKQKSVISEKELKEIFKAYINTFYVDSQDDSFEIKPIIVYNNHQHYFFPFRNGELPTIYPISENEFNNITELDNLLVSFFKPSFDNNNFVQDNQIKILSQTASSVEIQPEEKILFKNEQHKVEEQEAFIPFVQTVSSVDIQSADDFVKNKDIYKHKSNGCKLRLIECNDLTSGLYTRFIPIFTLL